MYNSTCPSECIGHSRYYITNSTCEDAFKLKSFDSTRYISQVEDYTILLEHTIYGARTGIKSHVNDMKGKLTTSDGETPRKLPGDVLLLSTLLNAAQVQLDDPNYYTEFKYPPAPLNETNRNAGMIIVLNIIYANDPNNPKKLTYNYEMSHIRGSQSKVEEVIFTDADIINQFPGSFLVLNRHGCRIVIA